MEKSLQECIKGNLLGNVRTGTRGENDRPVKLAYFNVHIDKSTPSLAVELFNKAYKNPNKIRIKFVCQKPMVTYYERYEGKRRTCYGNGNKAKVFDEKGKAQIIECNVNDCPYRKKRECKKAARLYFYMEKIPQEEGVWCFPIGSEKGISYIEQRIERANRLGKDLTNSWHELYLISEDAPRGGKNYIPDIREITDENLEKQNKANSKEVKENTNQIPKDNTNNNVDKSNNANQENKKQKNDALKNCLMYKGSQITIYKNQKVPKLKFMNVQKQDLELILMPNEKKDNEQILYLKPGSIILPLKTIKEDTNTILYQYKVLKAISDEIENKKAV